MTTLLLRAQGFVLGLAPAREFDMRMTLCLLLLNVA
jgi:hypothetical protein